MTDKEYKEYEHFKKVLGVGDVATRGYKAAVRILEHQIEFLDKFNLNEEVGKTSKEDPTYDRAMKIFKELPEVITSLRDLKEKLGIDYVEKETKARASSPQSIGKLTN